MIRTPDISETGPQKPVPPHWIMDGSVAQTPENAAFLAGAAFAMLDMVLKNPAEQASQASQPASRPQPACRLKVPSDLLANTLALQAAVATSKLEGRLASDADIRDAWRLTQPDPDGVRHWGPDGDGLAFWRRAVRLRLTAHDWPVKLAALLRDTVPSLWHMFRDTVSDNFRVIDPKEFRVIN